MVMCPAVGGGRRAGWGANVASKEQTWKQEEGVKWGFLGSLNFTHTHTQKKQVKPRILFLCPNPKVAGLNTGPSDSVKGNSQHRSPIIQLPTSGL